MSTHSRAIMHAGGVVVQTALAMAERHSRSGRDVPAAIVAGYEIAARIGMLASKGFHAQGFHSTSICGTFAAAATASMLMGLNPGHLGEPTSPPRPMPARGPPLREMQDSGSDTLDSEAQPAPHYEFDQRIAW